MAHEKTITVGFGIGGTTRFFNIPTVHKGKTMTKPQAIKRFKAKKRIGEGFGSIKEAVQAAGKRSRGTK